MPGVETGRLGVRGGEAGTPTTARPGEPSERAEDPGASAATARGAERRRSDATAGGASAGERREERARRGGRDDGTSEREDGAAATMTRTRVGRGAKQRRTGDDVLFVPADDDSPRARLDFRRR
jgi:hypothetical protein